MNCYAAFAKDADIRNSGSSGGLFPLISLQFIQNGGVVYAAEYDDSFRVVFNRYATAEDVKRSFTSKYVQSRLNDTFLRIKADLKADLSVLFCGTPCQTAALSKYLQLNKTPTHHLLLINFICHGVPSEDVFQEYMRRFTSPSCTSLNMRNKDLGWDYGRYAWKMTFSDGSQTTTPQSDVPYMKGFLSNLYLRPSCYSCKKECYESADITLGDFWSISERYPEVPSRYGVSCVIVRTPSGEAAFSQAESDLEVFSVQYRDILYGNPCLESPSKKPYFRNRFFRAFKKGKNIDRLITKMGIPSYKNRIINKLYSKLSKCKTPVSDLNDTANKTLFHHKEQCCGCVACYNVCSKKAIALRKDHEGFIYPVINTAACTNCRLCEAVCPLL